MKKFNLTSRNHIEETIKNNAKEIERLQEEIKKEVDKILDKEIEGLCIKA